ncbi:putative transcriptional regulator [Pseudomonas sp. MT-1]|nr:putative transcriptional regulator [Pseudomonas sp. MT-1]
MVASMDALVKIAAVLDSPVRVVDQVVVLLAPAQCLTEGACDRHGMEPLVDMMSNGFP